jgi:putative tricarboxylic transport membrane protein
LRGFLPDRLLGLALLALGAGIAWHAQSLEVAFAADPIGPRAFPTLVAAVIGGCGLFVALRPNALWEPAEQVVPGLAATAAMAAYALLLVPLGFIPATFLLCIVIALAFSARPLQAVLSAAVTAPGLWLLLDRLLDLPLPRGPLGV